METCKFCGGTIIGDGSTMPKHCENVSVPLDMEPDASVLLCRPVFTIDDVHDHIKRTAEKHGWNVNEKYKDAIAMGMLRNLDLYGKMYCPCSFGKTDDDVCPCTEAEFAIIERGRCHCMLFTS